MNRIIPWLLLALSQGVSGAELFGVPLGTADKGSLGFAAQRAGATLLQTERNQVFEVFDSSAVLDVSFKLYLGFDVQTGKFGFAEYHIHRIGHRTMLARLTAKYGEPTLETGEFSFHERQRWQVDGIEISLQKARGCLCSQLIYSEPATHAIVRQQHEQVQRQRAEEVLETFQKAY
ncbi:MAG: hypothetical protein AAF460_13225 [Pseudomonadota bacterium]